MSDPSTIEKIANLPKIMEAARTLWLWGLSSESAEEVVKRFVQKNPDVKARIERVTAPKPGAEQ